MLKLCGKLTQSSPKPATVSLIPFYCFQILTDWLCVACSAKRGYEPEGREFESLRAHHSFVLFTFSAESRPPVSGRFGVKEEPFTAKDRSITNGLSGKGHFRRRLFLYSFYFLLFLRGASFSRAFLLRFASFYVSRGFCYLDCSPVVP
jgi:hypothetical protein